MVKALALGAFLLLVADLGPWLMVGRRSVLQAPDTTAPTVSVVSPTTGSTDVAVNAVPTATFSEVLTGASVTTSTATLVQGVTPVTVTVSYTDPTVTLTPMVALSANTAYTARITTGVTDLAGNHLASDFTWTFTTGATSPDLFQTSDLIYDGSFRVPSASVSGTDYCPCALAFDPLGNSGAGSLFMSTYQAQHPELVGGVNWGGVLEMSIPTPLVTASLGSMNRAGVLQADTDALDGTLFNSRGSGNQSYIGGLAVRGTTLYLNATPGYDADGNQPASFYKRSRTLSTPSSVSGPFGTNLAKQAFTAGYMADVPASRQAAFGGDLMVGLWSTNIVTVESSGPSAFTFNAAVIGSVGIAPSTLLFYTTSNPLGPTYGPSGVPCVSSPSIICDGDVGVPYNPGTSGHDGAFIPIGKRSVMFFGGLGTGGWCYGVGTSVFADNHVTITMGPDAGDQWCYDPENSAKGGHSYPAKAYYWIYDINDLLAVKAGSTTAYAPRPYAYGNLAPLISTFDALYAGQPGIMGVAYDQTNKRVYLAAGKQDGPSPVIHRFHHN